MAAVLVLISACKGRSRSEPVPSEPSSPSSITGGSSPPLNSAGPQPAGATPPPGSSPTGPTYGRYPFGVHGGTPFECSSNTSLVDPAHIPKGTSPAAVAAFTFPPADAPAEEQPVTKDDIQGLITAFKVRRALRDIPVIVVEGSGRVAYMPSTGQRWAMATFALAPGSDLPRSRVGLSFDSPYDRLVFVQPPFCPWAATREVLSDPFPCPNLKELPAGVQSAWGLNSPSEESCANPRARPITR